jgi:hypothetical protein
MTQDLPYLIAVGTQVVTAVAIPNETGKIAHPQGAVGVVVKVLDEDSYRVRFLDGFEAVLARPNLTIRKHFQRQGLQAAAVTTDYHQYIIYRCVVGSRAYGLHETESDIDRRGIYLPPAEQYWSLVGVPEQLENRETQECYWEMQKFINLALKANPNILECLYTPLVEYATPLAEELLHQRDIFLSKLIYQTYNGYVLSQFRKMNKHWQKNGHIKWKHAMHLIRLLLSGITVLREGFVPVQVEAYRDQLLAIRRGEWGWEAVNSWRMGLHKEFDDAFQQTHLPEQPNYEAANALLLKARWLMVGMADET